MRVWDDTHAILKVLAAYKRMTLIELIDSLVREEAKRVGFDVGVTEQTPAPLTLRPLRT